MLEYTIFLEFNNGEVMEGCTYSTAEECWERIDKAISAIPELEGNISFQVIEKRC